jgi:ankyrin repeat protein
VVDATTQPGTKAEVTAKEKKAAANATVDVDKATFAIKVTPERLDLGQIPTGDTGRGPIKLVNRGTESVVLNQCKTNCGCTATNCPKGKTIEPGEEVEIEVTLKGGLTPRRLSKKVTLIFNDNQSLVIPVSGEAISYVTALPATLTPNEGDAEGRVTIKATDGKPFVITKMAPAIIAPEDFAKEHQEEHIVYVDWAKWRELGSSRRLFFYLDHPQAERVSVNVRATAKRAGRDATDQTARLANGERTLQKPNVFAVEREIKRGNIDPILQQIDSGELDPETADRGGGSLLSLASKHGSIELVQALIERKVDIDATDKVGRTALMTAAQNQRAEIVEVLLDAGASIDSVDLVGSTALSWAAGFGDPDTVHTLIDHGAKLDVAGTPTGFTPLIWASGFGNKDSVTALVEAGADLEAADMTQGLTALMHASRTGTVEKVKILLEAGAKIDARDNSGKTPLLVAAEASGANVEMIQILVEKGADVTAKDDRGMTALQLASQRGDANAVAITAYLTELAGTSPGGSEN